MTDMPASLLQRGRSAAFRFASLLVLVAQLVVALLAPATDARAAQGALAHVEVPGSHHHVVHVDALCLLCSAQHLLAQPETASLVAAYTTQAEPAQLPEVIRHTLLLGGGCAPRAPPRDAGTS
ncbi:MAG: hypothetical protein ACR2G6_02655 [Gemmatimonadaceae bacterium]